jgi:hypothetical protein
LLQKSNKTTGIENQTTKWFEMACIWWISARVACGVWVCVFIAGALRFGPLCLFVL